MKGVFLMKYDILTKHSMLDMIALEDENEVLNLVEEQTEVLESLGFDYSKSYIMVFNGNTKRLTTIEDAIQMLALKEGADLVRFEDGNIGFVGYYGSWDTEKNNFKIIREATEDDEENF